MKSLNIFLLCLLTWTGAVRSQSDDIIIKTVNLIGNDHVSINEVMYIIRQRPPNWFVRQPEFDSRLLKLDALTLKSFYHSKGFLDVKLEESYSIENNFAHIVYKIEEGKQYFISKISMTGNHSISEKKIIKLLGLNKRKPYNPVFINDNL